MPRRLVVSLACLALACPGVAAAQSPGDEQYQDPFPSESQGGGAQGGAAQDAPELQGQPPAGSADSEARATTEETPAGRLPATGGEAALIALAGMGLLMSGLGLRLRLRVPGA